MKRSSPPTRKTPMKRGGRIKPNATRAKVRTDRTHGPKSFRAFTAQAPCSACGILGYSQAAHLLGNGGMGRKQDWTTIAPLCGPHPTASGGICPGCHARFDELLWEFNDLFPTFNPEAAVEAHPSETASEVGQ